MPEGDVVLRTARRLTAALTGPLTSAELRWPTVAGVDLLGRRALETVSHGKHLLTRFDDGRTLHTHLRMEGRYRVERTARPARRIGAPSARVVLADERWTCIGHDLGVVDVVPTDHESDVVGHLGPDLMVLDPAIDTGVERMLADPSREVGIVLLDQRVAAGIGTIYRSETLWTCRVNPWTPVGQVPDPGELLRVAATAMRRSADARTISATGDARPGRAHHVYGRARRACRRCGTPIGVAQMGQTLAERIVYWCPRCQPGG